MSLGLHVDADRWRAHLQATADAVPGLVPVAKGNGYGFGVRRLAAEAARLGVPALAVGTYAEVPAVRDAFPGDVLVLEPWTPGAAAPLDDQQVVHTVTAADHMRALAGSGARVVLEQLTSMRRFGFDVASLVAEASTLRLEGVALHLPLGGSAFAEARALVQPLRNVIEAPIWVSHLDPASCRRLGEETGASVRARVGTALWLGDRGALRVTARLLAAHQLRRGDTFGYRRRRAPRAGWLLVASGGTSHGIALEAPKPATNLRARAVAVGLGALEALGRNPSPFTYRGRRLWFAEPPHMHVSMLWWPYDEGPTVGDDLAVDVRYTTTAFDRIVGLDTRTG